MEMKWSRKGVKVRITGVTSYSKVEGSGTRIFLALKMVSDDFVQIREELGLEEKPDKLEFHVTLFEMIVPNL